MATDKTAPPQTRPLTVEEFLRLELGEDTRYELHEGALIEMPPPKNLHGHIVMYLSGLLFNFVLASKLGRVFTESTGYILGNDRFYIPDVSFISFERAPELGEYFYAAPELAVEVLSPSNTQQLMRVKIRAFLEAGTQVVWVIDPKTRTLDGHTFQDNGDILIRTYGETDSISGPGVLAEFSFTLGDVLPPRQNTGTDKQ